MTLHGILEAKRRAAACLPDAAELLARRTRLGLGPPRPFAATLAAAGRGAVIGEVKRASPSAGTFGVAPLAAAAAYAASGAGGLSILADPHFGMQPEEFPEIRQAAGLPALWKDFILGDRQIDLAYGQGADCVLLIARLHDAASLARLAAHAAALGLEVLFEVHEAAEIERLPPGATLVGANARDLADPRYATDPARLAEILGLLRSRLPGALLVAESGFSGPEEVRSAFARGPYDAFLVGTSLLRALERGEDLRERISALREAAEAVW